MCRRLTNFASSAQSHDLSCVHTMRASVCRFGRNWKDIVCFVGTRSVSQVSQWVKFRTFTLAGVIFTNSIRLHWFWTPRISSLIIYSSSSSTWQYCIVPGAQDCMCWQHILADSTTVSLTRLHRQRSAECLLGASQVSILHAWPALAVRHLSVNNVAWDVGTQPCTEALHPPRKERAGLCCTSSQKKSSMG